MPTSTSSTSQMQNKILKLGLIFVSSATQSLQFFIIIIIIMMAWFMRVFQQNALAPSSVYSILPQCIRPHFLSCICVFSFLFTAMHVKSLAFCVREWRRYSIQYNSVQYGVQNCENTAKKTLQFRKCFTVSPLRSACLAMHRIDMFCRPRESMESIMPGSSWKVLWMLWVYSFDWCLLLAIK